MSEYETFTVQFKHETEAAWLVDFEGREVWLPKVCVTIDKDPKMEETMDIEIPLWLAEERDMV